MAVTEYITKRFHHKYIIGAVMVLVLTGLVGVFKPSQHVVANNYKYVTVHYDGIDQTLATDAKTIGELLDRADIPMDDKDVVEPAKNTALIANDYNVNVYRARPVTVIDAGNRYPIITAAQSPKQIAEAAGLTIFPEDKMLTSRVDDFVGEGTIGLKVTVDRAVPVNFSLYGNPQVARTQAATVGEFLKEKGVTIQPGDTISPDASTAITAEMIIAVNHNGTQVVTVEEEIAFEVEQIRDADREVGYREVKEAGQKGRKLVTYELKMENGKEVGRKALNSLTKTEPKKQVEIIGTKSKNSGSREEWLRTLRVCETGGNYQRNSGNGYYGAYQFLPSTWNNAARSSSRPDLIGVSPDKASPADQDAMVIANTNLAKGGLATQHPGCYRSKGLSQFPPD